MFNEMNGEINQIIKTIKKASDDLIEECFKKTLEKVCNCTYKGKYVDEMEKTELLEFVTFLKSQGYIFDISIKNPEIIVFGDKSLRATLPTLKLKYISRFMKLKLNGEMMKRIKTTNSVSLGKSLFCLTVKKFQ